MVLEISQADLSPVPPTLGDPCETMPPNPSVPWLNTAKPEPEPRRKGRQGGRAAWN